MPRLSRLALERAKSSHDQIAAILGTELLKGAYPPGANMPSEPELIERFQVSRTVLREVMKTLAAKGFVLSKTRVGTRVRDPVYWNYFDADVLAWRVRLGLDDGGVTIDGRLVVGRVIDRRAVGEGGHQRGLDHARHGADERISRGAADGEVKVEVGLGETLARMVGARHLPHALAQAGDVRGRPALGRECRRGGGERPPGRGETRK